MPPLAFPPTSDVRPVESLTSPHVDDQELSPRDDDALLVQAVVQVLRGTGHSPLREVDVEICGQVVILWGRVPSYYLKQLAQALAQRVPGVHSVANGLEVICSR